MRIRAGHIALFMMAAITAFVFYAVSLRGNRDVPPAAEEGLSPPVNLPMEDAPQIALETEHLDLGVIPNNQVTETSISVSNRGGNLLEIRDVRSSCPVCTIGYFTQDAHRILPGQSSPLHLKVNPNGIHGFHSQKTVTLICNDPRRIQATITVEARVDPEFEVVPDGFAFGDVLKGAHAESVLRFRSLAATPVTIQKVSLNSQKDKAEDPAPIAFRLEPVDESDWQQPGHAEYNIVATLLPEMRGGAFELSVFLHTDLERFSPYLVVARGTIIAPYTVELNQNAADLHVRNNMPGQITIQSREPAAITEVRSEQGYVELQQSRESPEVHRIQCTPAPSVERGILKDYIRITIEVDNTAYTERIPVTVYSYGASDGR